MPAPVLQAKLVQGLLGNAQLTFDAPVTAGSTLLLVHAGAGFGVPPQASVVSAVADDLNGPWTSIWNSGNQDDGASHNWALAAYVLVGSVAGAPTVSLTASSGQNGATALLLELEAGSVDVLASAAQIGADGSGRCVTPVLTSATQANDWVLAAIGGQAPQSPNAVQSSGWTVDGNVDASAVMTGTAALLVAHRDAQTTAGEMPAGITVGGYWPGAVGWAGLTLTLRGQGGGTPQQLTPPALVVTAGLRPAVASPGPVAASLPSLTALAGLRPAVVSPGPVAVSLPSLTAFAGLRPAVAVPGATVAGPLPRLQASARLRPPTFGGRALGRPVGGPTSVRLTPAANAVVLLPTSNSVRLEGP